MTLTSRILAALLLAGATTGAVGCGDDDDNTGNPSGNEDAGSNADSSTSNGNEDAGTSDEDGGETPDVVVATCPKHPNVTDDKAKKICVIKATKDAPIVEPLELAPVKDYLGYVLSGAVFVGQDVGGGATPDASKKSTTLTIKPGTVIAGSDKTAALAINRGSKIEAVGTENAPIVFTSIKVLAGESGAAPQDWGGLVLLGRAKQNKGANPVTELDTGTYGGDDDADSSGTLKYVRVEFSGSRSSSEKEFNGITFYGVGSGTTVDYIHVHAGSDDAVEFFGGNVNVKHLVVTGPGDDGIDWTDGYRGKIQYAVVQQYPNYGDNAVEADNQKSELEAPISNPTLANFTFIGQANANGDLGNGLLLRVGTQGKFFSGLTLGFKTSCIATDATKSKEYAGSSLVFSGSRVSCTNNFVEGGEAAFPSANGNSVLASADVLKSISADDKFDFTPKDGANLTTGGQLPAGDSFFEANTFIGAFGSENWIKGSWVKITAFDPK